MILTLKLKEKIFFLLRKDYQKVRVDRYKKMGVKIGDGCRIFTDLLFSEPYLVSIGNNVTISNNVNLLTHDNSIIKFCDNATDVVGKITLGDNYFIGANVVILPGVTLAEGTIVGAGSVVTKSCLEKNQILAGNPAKIISDTTKIKNKYHNMTFDLRGLDKNSRMMEILSNEDKLISR